MEGWVGGLTMMGPPVALEPRRTGETPVFALGLLGEVTGACGEPLRLKVVLGGSADVWPFLVSALADELVPLLPP